MTDVTSAQLLHDKATCGGTLTKADQTKLDAWYTRQDAEEMAQFVAFSPASSSLDSLRAIVSAATRQLNEITQRIQAQFDKNEKLRQENAVLGKHFG